ncbi:two-component system sensor histidine kinase NtrB [Ghiorsea bivora]|uniref:two-component system sensor histidine kinase NtrB n=1 Tax=Ghiorsea bivora TaxID=1485545 RepID=UPI00068B0BCF|nr:ATP-binding protein [Ghiorsea bivora]
MSVTTDSIFQGSYEKSRLSRLFIARNIGLFILLVTFSWFIKGTQVNTQVVLPSVFLLWLFLLVAQWILLQQLKPNVWNLLFQLCSDFILIGVLIFSSGGIASPLVFLLGVIIIIAGAQARVLLVLTTAVLAAMTYLIAIYIYAASQHTAITDEHTLKILLQTSLFFLAGGIMALIARRHSNLQQAEHSATKAHKKLQALNKQILYTMQEGMVFLDDRLYIHDYNPAAQTLLNLQSNCRGKALHTILHTSSDMLYRIMKSDCQSFKSEQKNGDEHLLFNLVHIRGEQNMWLMTIVNITETRNLEQKLAEQDKLASLGQMASMLAHEIRNPMQSIAQAVELMGLQQPNNNLERIVTDEISRLNRLVSDMLNYASPLQPHVQHVSILKLLQTSVAHIDLNNQYQIQINCPDLRINIDPDHFRLVTDNLIRNAVHASPEPASIILTFKHHKNTWSFNVRDHGKGIHGVMRKKLFEPFQTNRKQGTGLGLATVWQVCQVNGWRITLDETIHDGSCFVITSQPNSPQQGENRKQHG